MTGAWRRGDTGVLLAVAAAWSCTLAVVSCTARREGYRNPRVVQLLRRLPLAMDPDEEDRIRREVAEIFQTDDAVNEVLRAVLHMTKAVRMPEKRTRPPQ